MAEPMQDDSAEQKTNESTNDTKKLIIISGVTSGIGAGMLRRFTAMGHIVGGFGRREENVIALRKELQIKDETLITNLDICNEEAVTKWSKSILQKYGPPYLVINNAGSVVGCNKDTWDLSLKDLMTSLSIHIGGSALMIKLFVPAMRQINQGMLINISSWAGQNGYAGGTPYCASKFGIEGLTQCLAKELVDMNPNNQILACCVSPGFVNTSMLKGSFAEQAAKQQNVDNGDEWAKKTCQWILELDSKKDSVGKLLHHGQSIGPPIEKESMKKYCDFFKVYGVEMELDKYVHQ